MVSGLGLNLGIALSQYIVNNVLSFEYKAKVFVLLLPVIVTGKHDINILEPSHLVSSDAHCLISQSQLGVLFINVN